MVPLGGNGLIQQHLLVLNSMFIHKLIYILKVNKISNEPKTILTLVFRTLISSGGAVREKHSHKTTNADAKMVIAMNQRGNPDFREIHSNKSRGW